MLTGKGMFFWQIDKTELDVQQRVKLAKGAGLTHVMIKVSDGEFNFPIPAKDPGGKLEKITHDAIQAFKEAGIAVWGWGFVYGSGVDNAMQAHRLAARVRRYDMDGVVINAEDFGLKKWSSASGAAHAKQLMEILKDDLSDRNLSYALSSYRYLSVHGGFPFAAFMDHCDIAMPQVYWVAKSGGDPIANLKQSFSEYQAAFPNAQYVPTGASFGQYFGSGASQFYWSAKPEQIKAFMREAKRLGIDALNFWSWQHARHDAANALYPKTQLWDAIASIDYGSASVPGSDVPIITAPENDDASIVIISVGKNGHFDGVYPGMPHARYDEALHQGKRLKYAITSSDKSGVWAAWVPKLTESGKYEIAVWVPGVHGTTRSAKYAIHGIVGRTTPITVEIDQQLFSDEWVSLGVYPLDAGKAQSGMVNLNNLTRENEREIAFSDVRWQPASMVIESDPVVVPDGVADGFDAPVGTAAERASHDLWPGAWFDATGFATRYRDSGGSSAYHTGVDLNLNQPSWNKDAGMSVYAPASGVIVFAAHMRIWGNIVIIRHDPLKAGGSHVYSRLAHLAKITVNQGQRVARGKQVGTIGKPSGGTEHLHFDLSPTSALARNAGDWPLLDWARLHRDYIDPMAFIRQNRPRR